MPKEVHPVDHYVGNRIRLCRTWSNISQGALAQHLGISFQQVQKYERGTNRVSASRLYEIAEFLGTHPAWFFEGFAPLANGYPLPGTQQVHHHDLASLIQAISQIMDQNTRTQIIHSMCLFIEQVSEQTTDANNREGQHPATLLTV